MNASQIWIFSVGFIAQILFAARIIVQWFQSEKAKKSLSPAIFWQLSLMGSIVFLIYGILRKDFAIIFGQCLVYYIYIRNLHFKNKWILIHSGLRWIVLLAPLITLSYLFLSSPGNLYEVLSNKDIPRWLMIWGTLGQIVFTSRFFIQWIDSEVQKQSVLNKRFWITSLIGSIMIITYAAYRYDPVLFVGHLGGLIAYSRNLMISVNMNKR